MYDGVGCVDEATKVDEVQQIVLNPGNSVSVRWGAQWHRGTVIQLGPHPDLLKLKDITSDTTILLETRNVKLMEANTLDKQLYVGRRVGYHDNDEWKEAIIVNNRAIGNVLVRWRKSAFDHDPYSQSWFENSDVKLHSQDCEDDDMARKEAVEPNPILPGSISFSDGPQLPLPPIPQSQSYHGPYSSIHASPTYESMHSMFLQQPLAPHMFMHHAFNRYRPRHMYNHFQPLRIGIDPTGMETMSLQGLRSYPAHRGGIPPHITSQFFQNLYHRQQEAMCGTHLHSSPVHSSSSMPTSDPVPYAELNFNPFQQRAQSSTQISAAEKLLKSQQHSARRMPSKRPNPYEIPQPSRTNLQLEVETRNVPQLGNKNELVKKQRLCIQSSSPSEIRVEEGGSALLSVIVNMSNSDFTWYRNEEKFLGGKNISVLAPNILHLQHATQVDAGEYKCVISHGSDMITYTCNVTVFGTSLPIGGSSSKEYKSDEATYAELNVGPEQQAGATIQSGEDKSISEDDTPLSMELSDKDAATSAESANIELSNSSNQMTVPVQVVVSNPTPKIQRRISTVLKTDIQEYLQGYGEDYGATSSKTNLIEGVHSYSLPVGDDSPSPSMALSPTSQPDVSIAEENEGLTSMQLSSSPLDHQTDMDKSIPKFKKGLRHRLFGEKSKKNNDGEHLSDVSALGIKSDATIQNELMTSSVTPLHAEGKQKLDDTSTIMKNEDIDQPPTEHPADNDSVKVNLSLQESSGSEQASLNEQIDESLPLERESVSELVQKLQLSLEAHTPSYVIQQHQKKKSFVSNLFRGKDKPVQR